MSVTFKGWWKRDATPEPPRDVDPTALLTAAVVGIVACALLLCLLGWMNQ